MNQYVPPRMATIKQTARITNTPEHFVRTLCLERKISAVRAGNKWLVNVDRFIDFLNAPPEQPQEHQPTVRRVSG